MAEENWIWPYPLYVTGANDDWSAVTFEQPDGGKLLTLALFTNEQAARDYISGGPPVSIFRLNDGEELTNFFRTIKPQEVFYVAFISEYKEVPVVENVMTSEQICAQILWQELDLGYPAYSIAAGPHSVCVDGTAADGEKITALLVFTDEELAGRYQSKKVPGGRLSPIKNAIEFSAQLEDSPEQIVAVCFNLDPGSGGRFGKQCFQKDKLLERLKASSKPRS
jgi:hypothetical protein